MLASDVEEFRRKIRGWLEANCPPAMRTPMPGDELPFGGRRGGPAKNPDTEKWTELAASRGLTLPAVPKKWGGGGLTEGEVKVLAQEMRRIAARPPLLGSGLVLLVPALLAYGTEEQKQKFIPPIARGEVRWCQGFSEPEAGSDLASLRMIAERDGSDFVLNGQKTWTSFATVAEWMFCLARTDPTAPTRQQGITMFLVDMQTKGLSVRPIRLINGDTEFCESFFDNVRVPAENVLGEVNGGWGVAKLLLRSEREDVRAWMEASYSFPVVELWRENQRSEPEITQRVIRSELDRLGLDALMDRAKSEAARGDARAERFANIAKIVNAEYQQERAELAVHLLGEKGMTWSGGDRDTQDMSTTRDWLTSRAFSIAGGSTEIQLNILSKRWLGLPAS
jgi:acyl-CoA dehydrogenase